MERQGWRKRMMERQGQEGGEDGEARCSWDGVKG